MHMHAATKQLSKCVVTSQLNHNFRNYSRKQLWVTADLFASVFTVHISIALLYLMHKTGNTLHQKSSIKLLAHVLSCYKYLHAVSERQRNGERNKQRNIKFLVLQIEVSHIKWVKH